MALTYQQAVEQTITGAEQFHEIINGSATSEVVVEDGSKIPTVRKALLDNFYYKDPINWQQGQNELVFNQIRKFTDGTWWIAPTATATNPVVMGVTPYGDPLWKVFSWDRAIDSQKANRKLIERSWAEAGYNVVAGSFQEGATLNTTTDVIINYGSDFGVYSWGGTLPKVVPANSTVTGTGGISPTTWDNRNTEILRTQLNNQTGVGLIGGIGFTTPEQFGYTVGQGAMAFSSAAAAAADKGWYVKLDGKEYTLNSDADMAFVPVIGNGISKVTGNGVMKNTSSIKDVKLSNFNASDNVEGIMPALQKSGSILVRYAADSYYVLSKNQARNEYVSIRMRASAADGDAPWDLVREQSAFACELALAYESVVPSYGKAVYSGSGWSDFNFTSALLGFPSGTTSGTENAYCVGLRVSSGLGSYVDISPSSDDNGDFSVSFLRTTGSSGILDIYVDKGAGLPSVNPNGTTAVTPDATIFTNAPSIRIRKEKLNTPMGSALVRVVSRSNSPSYILGANVDTPETANTRFGYDNWAYYRKPTEKAYVVNAGASDYALRDLDKGALVGSFHGSEAKVADPRWIINGAPIAAFVDNKPVAGKEISIYQHTIINGKVTSKSEHSFGDGWVQKIIDLSGTMRSDTVYLGMCLPQVINAAAVTDCFTELLYPVNLDVKPASEYPIGGCNLVVWRNPVTEARVYAYHRNFSGWNAKSSPAYIKTAYGSTTYAKLYHNLQKDSENTFTHASSQIIHLYC